ncbi:DNA primase [Candidatus Kaiserbacteria bacterium]|nr:DNA primase [Candidatus Kaiserbacteria bacterium]
MMSDTVQQVKDKLSIVDVVSQYVKLERSGANLRARCPFHAERTPSFFVSPERGTYHCFGCNVGGDIFSFVEQIEGLDFKGALKVLAEKAGVPLVYGRGDKHEKDERDRLFELMEVATIFYASQLNDDVRKYLHERGVNDKTVKTFRLGYAGAGWSDLAEHLKNKKFSEKEILEAGVAKRTERGGLNDKFRNRIMFPIADSAGRIVAFSGRIFPGTTSPSDLATGQAEKTDGSFVPPKYMNSPETPLFHKSRVLYGLDKAKLSIRKHNCAVLVEGQIDLLASHQAGWGNTIAVSGTAFTPEHAVIIHRLTDNLVIALDADEAGIKAASRSARTALQAGLNVKVAALPSGLDPADLILSAEGGSASGGKKGAEAWRAAIRDAEDIIQFLLNTLEKHLPQKNRFYAAVNQVVLPFVRDIPNPSARHRYVVDITRRTGSTERAVEEEMEKLPETPIADLYSVKEEPERSSDSFGRPRQAFSVLLWQKALPRPELDLDAYERELEEALGKEAMDELESLSATEQEKLRFGAERMYAGSLALKAEAKTLLSVLLKERLSRELAEATAALKRAEHQGNEEEVAVHMSVCNVLTRRIARLHEVL